MPDFVVEQPWALDVEKVASQLSSDLTGGLNAAEAAGRLAKVGPNSLREAPPRSRLQAFLAQFADFMIALLAAAAVVAS